MDMRLPDLLFALMSADFVLVHNFFTMLFWDGNVYSVLSYVVCGLNRKGPRRLIELSLQCDLVGEGVALLKGMCNWGWV